VPKGYNQKAINGLLTFLEGCFEVILDDIRKGKKPEQAMMEELEEIRSRLLADVTTTDPSVVFKRHDKYVSSGQEK
jgi:hypothetical protein